MQSSQDADVVIVITCGFSFLQQNESIAKMKHLKEQMKEGAELWVGGCLPRINPSFVGQIGASHLFDPRHLEAIDELVNHNGTIETFIPNRAYSEITGLPETIFPIRISTGCLDRCRFCQIWRATGNLCSLPIEKLVLEVRIAASGGANIFHLVGEDCGCYGLDIGVDIFELVSELHKQVPDCLFYLSSINPRYFTKNIDRFLKMFSLRSMGPRLGLPLQSGSDRVLHLMGRRYTVTEFVSAVKRFRESFPQVALATDVLVGFPSETEEDFNQTLRLILALDFEYIDCFKFDAVEGAPAAYLHGQIPEEVKLHRQRLILAAVLTRFVEKRGIQTIEELERIAENPSQGLPVNINAESLSTYGTQIIKEND